MQKYPSATSWFCCAVSAAAAIYIGWLPRCVLAHGEVHAEIETLTSRIQSAPSAVLHLQRSELFREDEAFAAALADCDAAARLDPALAAVLLSRAHSLYQSGQFQAAREALDAFLEKKPAHAEAFRLRARALAALKRHADAVADFNRALALMKEPPPDLFLERAQELGAQGSMEAALASLDEGISQMGPLLTLQSAAIDVELQLGRHDAALARVDRILAGLQRKEAWLARRGQILQSAGRAEAARLAYTDALGSIEALPAFQRGIKATQELEVRLRSSLQHLPP